MKRQRLWQNFTVTKSELAWLIGHDPSCIDHWSKLAGLPREKNGRYHLRTCLCWFEKHCRDSAAIRISLVNLSQQRLGEMLNVTRQTIFSWEKRGLPRNDNGTYDLVVVLRWLPRYYKRLYEERYKHKVK